MLDNELWRLLLYLALVKEIILWLLLDFNWFTSLTFHQHSTRHHAFLLTEILLPYQLKCFEVVVLHIRKWLQLIQLFICCSILCFHLLFIIFVLYLFSLGQCRLSQDLGTGTDLNTHDTIVLVRINLKLYNLGFFSDVLWFREAIWGKVEHEHLWLRLGQRCFLAHQVEWISTMPQFINLRAL